MMEFIVAETSKSENENKRDSSALRQIDITVGAALMFVGVKLSLIMGIASGFKFVRGGAAIALVAMSLILGLLYLLSRASYRRRGLNMGAIIIFIHALLAMLLADATEGVSFLIAGLISIPVVLLWSRIMRFFFDVDSKPQRHQPLAGDFIFNPSTPSFSPVSGKTTANLNPSQRNIGELADSFSVTEDSTALLKNKLPQNPA